MLRYAYAGKPYLANLVPEKHKRLEFNVAHFYGPERALFEKTWKLPDIEEAK
jgi:hypothetical protein